MKLEMIRDAGMCNAYFWLDVGEKTVSDAFKGGKKVVLIGVGLNSIFAEEYLENKGIEIMGYADNNVNKQNRTYKGKPIYDPYTLFQREDIYFVICVPDAAITEERIQLIVNGVADEYSIVFKERFHSFLQENTELHSSVLGSVNYICLDGETSEKALPCDPWAKGAAGRRMGNINWLLDSTNWSHVGLCWTYDYLKQKSISKVMDIGPGYGLISCTLMQLFPDINYHYLILGDKSKSKLDPELGYEAGLSKIARRFGSRITYNFGMLEYEEDTIPGKFDLIILTEVFEHFVLNPIPTLKRIGESLNEGGRILLTTPAWGHIKTYKTWRDIPEIEAVSEEEYLKKVHSMGHAYQYDKAEMDEIINESGLQIMDYSLSDSINHNYWLGSHI